MALSLGTPLAVVGIQLGHKTARMTQRYAHMLPDVVESENAQVGAAIGGPLGHD